MRVVFTANSIGLGGTEKGMVLQAIALRDEGLDVRVAGVLGGGERVATLEAAGVPVTICDGDEERLVGALLGADVVIAARRGTPEPLLPAAARRAAVGHVVEWNIFGGVDDSADRELFACRLFISRMICERYRELTDASWPAFGARISSTRFPSTRRCGGGRPLPAMPASRWAWTRAARSSRGWGAPTT